MVDIINLILFVVLLVYTCRLVMWISKRVLLISKLKSLKKECGATVKFLRLPFLPTSLMSEAPDATVEINDTVYLIKFYSGGSMKYVHFASPKYSVRFAKMKAGRFVVNTKWRSGAFSAVSNAFNVGAKVFIMPDFPIPENIKAEGYGKKIEKVLIFNPAPFEVSYVSEEKTTIKLAFTGDEFYGVKIFTASSFAAYADRETRKNDAMMYF